MNINLLILKFLIGGDEKGECMNAFFNAVKRSPKLTALTAALAGAVVVPAALLAWGPERPTFTMANPANYVTFNSITNNPDQGDERNFVRIREAGAGNYGDEIQLQAGKEYEVSVFYHNNAATHLNDSGVGVALNTAMRVQMPATVKAGEKANFVGYVSASNAKPQQVWDSAYGTASKDLALRYVANSAKVHTKGAINGQQIPETLYTTGAALGYNAFDGKVPGCNDFEGWVVYRVKAVAPEFTVEKTVSKVGANAFSKSISVNAGDELEYKIQYKNTGTVTQTNVVVKDQLPAGVTYVAGSTNVANGGTNGKWKQISDNNIVTKTGVNIGTYAPNSNAFVKFKAKVATLDGLKCGVNTLVNTVTVDTANGSQSSTATVTVNKVCQGVPTELPETGIDNGVLTLGGLGALVAGITYAVRSTRIRSLLRG